MTASSSATDRSAKLREQSFGQFGDEVHPELVNADTADRLGLSLPHLQQLYFSSNRRQLQNHLKIAEILASNKLWSKIGPGYLLYILNYTDDPLTKIRLTSSISSTTGPDEWRQILDTPSLVSKLQDRAETALATKKQHTRWLPEAFPEDGASPPVQINWAPSSTPVILQERQVLAAISYFGFDIHYTNVIPTSDLVDKFYELYLKRVAYVGSIFDKPRPAYTLSYTQGDEQHVLNERLFKNFTDEELAQLQLESAFRFGKVKEAISLYEDAEDEGQVTAFATMIEFQRLDIFTKLVKYGNFSLDYLDQSLNGVGYNDTRVSYALTGHFTPFLDLMLGRWRLRKVSHILTAMPEDGGHSILYGLVETGDKEAIQRLDREGFVWKVWKRDAVEDARKLAMKLRYDDLVEIMN